MFRGGYIDVDLDTMAATFDLEYDGAECNAAAPVTQNNIETLQDLVRDMLFESSIEANPILNDIRTYLDFDNDRFYIDICPNDTDCNKISQADGCSIKTEVNSWFPASTFINCPIQIRDALLTCN